MIRTMLALLLLAATATAAEKLNVIVILADDLGHSDLGCQGSKYFETPHIDQLAKDGVQFTNAYSACTVCSPTRAALLTGQYPARLHLTDWIAGHEKPMAKLKIPDWSKQLDPKTFTLAKAFKDAGYSTASIGKWHLGDAPPTAYGFDVNIAGTNKGQPPSYFSPYGIPTLKDGPKGEFLTDRLASEACTWIEANKAKPFFLYLPHFAVHTPLMGKPEVIAKYKKKDATKNATYAALVESLDDSVGAIRAKLKELKLDGNTAIIFTSDNGGLIGNAKNPITTNLPFRAGKGSAYDGGVQVPLIVYLPRTSKIVQSEKWPDRSKMGEGHVRTVRPVMTIDILPTITTWLDLKVPTDHAVDGLAITMSPYLYKGPNTSWALTIPESRPLFWHYPHYHPGGATPYSSMVKDEWKLIEFHETGRLELYYLRIHPEEANDLAAKVPAKLKELHDELKAWRTSVGAQMPTPNPDFKPNPQEKNGTILLHSREAKVIGKTLRYEHQPFKDTLGFWTNKDDYATWDFTVFTPGEFTVQVLQGCGKGQGGSDALVKFGDTELAFTVEDTGGFQEFKPREVGTISIAKAGQHTLELHAKTKAKGAVMDCRQILLTPKK